VYGKTVLKKRPNKHRYVKGFHKGIELYGAFAERLQDRKLKESLGKHGLIIVEGQNDVMRLDCLGIAAIALCSNKATDTQIEKLEQISRSATQGKITLMPDNDQEGEAGFKELLWEFASRGLNTRLAWSSTSHNGKFTGLTPEDVDDETLSNLLRKQ